MEKDKEIRWNFRSYFEILEHSATSKWKQSFNKRGKSANIEDPLDGKQRIASVLFSLILVDGSCSLPKEYLNPWANEELSKLAKSAINYAAKFIVYDKTPINDSYVKAAKLLTKKNKNISEFLAGERFIRIYNQINPDKFQALARQCIRSDISLQKKIKDNNSSINALLSIEDSKEFLFFALVDVVGHRDNTYYKGLPFDFAEEYDIGNKSAAIQEEKPLIKPENTFEEIELLTKPPRLLVEHYKKRDKAEYDRLQQALNSSNGKVFIQGLSGLGKSEFAKEFWKNSLITKSFRYFAWIDFKDDLETSFYQQYFLADDKNTTESYNRSKLLKIINSMGDKLLVIVDNFLSDEKFQRDKFLEDLCALNCTLLITTTENLEYSGIKKYELGFLSQTNSIDLFETYYTLESNKNKISKIVECLGYHTISIELVSKSCNAEGFTLDRTLDFLSENDLNYSDVEVSINHPRLVTNESVSKHLGTLFSIMMKSLNDEALELLIKFSIFKTIPFPLEDIKILFGIESAKPLLRLVKSGWIRAEKLPGHYKGDYYSIHLVAALVVINKFDIFPYFEKFRQKIRNISLSANNPLEQNIYLIEIANSFINTFIHSVKSFGFVILLTNYVNLLLAIASVSTVYINTIEQYLKSAKEILKVLDEHDFKIFILTSDLENSYLLNSLLGMDAPYTVKNLKHKLLFLLNNAFLYTLKINMSRDSLNKQEDMALILLRGLPEPSNSLIEYEKLTLNIYLLELYCDYCQKEKIPTFINKIIGLQKKISNHKQSNIVAKLDFIRLESLCYQTIANAYIIIGEYDNAQDYLDKTKETASSYIKAVYPESQNEIGVNDIFVETIVAKYNYSISKLVIFEESGEEAYKKILMEKYENIRNSDLEKHIKIKKCEEILFQYDPFFKEHSNYEGYDF
ncbi:NB-ARC domain-containing protein [Lactococcus lactis]|uniref:NB-ARC domain-containing protein n=1 Tax=Lactococcus lactis TaxID=1358 RepID=UPI0028907A1A|nr:NB-ARC domain-containing protein [Lactococcus lactis]MDT2897165.1 NB-ARC domain-containing protein [Lactococcus lactis]MDT2969408.1 NB-ARC domain-containing protein [Lactococcus lactis]